MPRRGYRVQPRRFNAGTVRRNALLTLGIRGLNLSRRFELGVKRDALLLVGEPSRLARLPRRGRIA